MKKLVVKISLLLPFLFLLIGVNLISDPARIFKSKEYERKIADALIAGHVVTDLENVNFDDRALEKFMIQSLKGNIDIGVFGSSRVMFISSAMFPGKRLFNNGLSASSVEDFVCLYEIYREQKNLPSTIIIGVDPWVFNKNNNCIKWHWFGQYYDSKYISAGSRNFYDLKIKPQDIVPYNYQQLVSVSYFQAGLHNFIPLLVGLFHKHPWFTLTDRKCNKEESLLPDGSRTFTQKEREVAVDDVRKEIQRGTDDAPYISGFFALDPDLMQKFVALVQLMKKDGVKAILFLPPYHPLAYDYYMHSNEFKIINDVEGFLRHVSATYQLPLVGSYNPHQLSIPESSFSDDMHLRDDTELKRIFSPVLTEPGLI